MVEGIEIQLNSRHIILACNEKGDIAFLSSCEID